MSEHYIGRPVSSEEIGLNRPSRKTPVVEQETQYHRTSEQTRESLRRQPAFELSEEDQRSLLKNNLVDGVVDAACPCPPVSCRCVHNGTNQA